MEGGCTILACCYGTIFFIYIFYSNNVSCEFDELGIDTHLCKLRILPVVRF